MSIHFVSLSKKCSGKRFGGECHKNLLFSKGLSNNKNSLAPCKVYLYKPVSELLKEMLQIVKVRDLLGHRFSSPPSTETEYNLGWSTAARAVKSCRYFFG